MAGRFSLRTRLTVFITAAFAVVTVLIAVVAVNRVEEGLIQDTRASAEAVLGQYLESVNGGMASVGVVGEERGTQFFYLDDEGQNLSEAEYFNTIAIGLDSQFMDLISVEGPVEIHELDSLPIMEGSVIVEAGTFNAPVAVDPETGLLVDPTGTVLTFLQGPIPDGRPEPVDLGADVVAVAQTLVLPDGSTVSVGVSTSLLPVTDSLDAVRSLLWIAMPLLILVVAGIVWLAATSALSTVSGISTEARKISANSPGERLPVPQANDEIRRLVETVNAMLDRLQRSQDRQRQLVADASHELRSPVAASRVQLEVATVHPDQTDWAVTAKTVLAEQERLSELIDDLLALSRLDESGSHTMAPVDLGEVVLEEAARPRSPLPKAGVRPSADALVLGDRRLLARAVGNLLDNAARHADDRVEVSVLRTTDRVVIHVDDDGPGVPAEDRERIFDRFTRLDEARDRDRGGAGLGLAITRDIAGIHGGDVACTTSPLGGARMTLSVPAN